MLPDMCFGTTCFGILSLRMHVGADADDLVLRANHPEVVKYALDSFPHPYSVYDAREYLAMVKAQQPRTHYALTMDDKLIGGFSIERGSDIERRSAVITYWLGTKFWSRGIATTVVNGVSKYVFGQTDIVRLSARVFDGNHASEKMLKKCGFVKEGIMRKSIFKRGIFMDGHLYAKIKE